MHRKINRNTWYTKKNSTIELTGKVNSFNVKDYSSALTKFKESGVDNLTLDFSRVLHAYPNGMLPIISSIELLRRDGIKVYVKLPNKDDVRRMFRSVNWAHFLSPEQFDKSESNHDRHLVTRFFNDETEQHNAVNDFMDVVLRNMEVPKDIISGLEWSMNEITDNVLNHSQSKIGGIVQASTYPKNGHIAFAVADAGRGILESLKEGIPTLRTDMQAMGEAIKSGVTRNPKYGQGNGLAGSLKITTLSGGSLEITSGRGRMISTSEETRKNERNELQNFAGTVVCGQININKEFSISEALDFGQSGTYEPVDFVEMQYEMDDKDCLILNMKDETTGFGSRRSGGQIRTKLNNLLDAKPNYPLVINWEGVPVISSSFADELIGKMFLKMGAISFSSRIRNVGMESLITKLLDKAVSQRLTQALDDE
jgi:anti-anti-sigma regulatory factor/anti-sigma regulatory factor (Ser/Thr protein kinase)